MKAEQPHRGHGWENGAGAAVVAVFGAFALVLVLRYVERPQHYPDFIVGFLAWNDYAKFQDLLVLPALVVAVIVAILAWRAALRRLDDPGTDPGARDTLVEHVLLWSIPAAASASTLVIGTRADHFLITASFAGVAALVALAGTKAVVRGEDVAARSFALLALALLSFLPLAVSLLGGRFAGTSEAFAGLAAKVSRWAFPALVLLGAVALAKAPGLARRAVPWAILLAQAGMLAFFVLLLPVPMLAPDGSEIRFRTSPALALIVASFVAAGFIDIGRRLFRGRGTLEAAPARLLSPVALFGLLVALRFGNTAGPVVTADDYHAGEVLVGWWSWLEHAKLPYRDYFPPHGLLADDLPGVLGRWLHDGTAASITESRRVFVVLTLFAAFLALHWRTGSVLLAFVAVLYFGVIWESSNWVVLAAICVVLVSERWSWPRVAAWAACAILLVIAVPAQGGVLVAACALPMLLFAWAQRGRLKEARVAGGVAAAVAGLAIVAATPLHAMWLGAVRYVLENGAANQAAWGLPWEVSWNSYSRRSGLVFEALRMSWMAMPLIAAGLVATRWRRAEDRPWIVGVAIPVILLFLLLSPYAMGRIDLDAQSRAGIFSNFAWSAIAPLLLFPLLGDRGRAALVLAIATIGSALGIAVVNRPTLDQAMNPALRLPVAPVDGAAAGLPNVGRSIVDATHWGRLQDLKRTLDGMLPPDAPYLNLTNRQAQHFYLGRPTALATPAPFNNAPIAQQRREVEALSRDPPQVALLEAENLNNDGGTAALRAPLLYRFVLDHYEPELREGFVVARRKAAPSGPGTGLDPAAREQSLALWDRAFRVPDLLKIPSSWGRSWGSLEARVARKAVLTAPKPTGGLAAAGEGWTVSGAAPGLSLDLQTLKVAGRDAGLLGFTFACQGKRAAPRLRVAWWGDADESPAESASLKFTAEDGMAIVPLDAYPRWMAIGMAKGLTISLENPEACSAIVLRDPWLGQRAIFSSVP